MVNYTIASVFLPVIEAVPCNEKRKSDKKKAGHFSWSLQTIQISAVSVTSNRMRLQLFQITLARRTPMRTQPDSLHAVKEKSASMSPLLFSPLKIQQSLYLSFLDIIFFYSVANVCASPQHDMVLWCSHRSHRVLWCFDLKLKISLIAWFACVLRPSWILPYSLFL